MTRVQLVAGPLGAGKTTVLRQLLAHERPGTRVGLVVNDFGTAGIDAEALSGGVLREIRGSCVCCTAPEGFAAVVGGLLDDVDVVFVEPTGLARTADLVDTIRRAPWADRIVLGPIVGVVDAADPDPATLAVADVVVVNRLDHAGPELARERIAALWPGPARVVETTFGAVPDGLLAPVERRPRILPPAEAHELDVHSPSWDAAVVFRCEALVDALARSGLRRAKGLFRTDLGWQRIELAGGRVAREATGWRTDSRADLIGAPAVLAAFRAATDDLGALIAPAAARDVLEVDTRAGVRTWTRDALRALPAVDAASRFPKRAGSAAPLPSLLGDAVGDVIAVAADGYVSAPVPRSAVEGGLVVHSSGDEPLPDSLGGPFRLLVPGEVACANVKALVRLVVR